MPRLAARARGDRPSAAATKIGGDPDLAPGEAWPHNHRGIPPVADLAAGRYDRLVNDVGSG